MLTAPANHIPANNPILTYQTFLGAQPTAGYQGYNHSPGDLNPVCTPLSTQCARATAHQPYWPSVIDCWSWPPIAVKRSIGVKRIWASSLFCHFNKVMSSLAAYGLFSRIMSTLDAYGHFIRIVSYLAAYGHFICVWVVYWGIKKAAQAINLAAFF